jgi:chromosome segregation ATPase
MSAIGRIFLVLNLILSALFVGWAAKIINAENSYRTQYETKVSEAEAADMAANQRIDELSAQLSTQKALQADVAGERDDLEREVANLKSDLETERLRVAELESNDKTMTNALSGFSTRIESMDSAKDAAVAEARDAMAERDAAVAARMQADTQRKEAEDMLDQANLQIADLEKDLTASEKMVSRQSAQLATIVDEYQIDLDKLMSQEYVEGNVLSVKNADGISLVALNVGSEDKVMRGMTFQIWHQGRYKGEVRVESVSPKMCSALVTMLADDSVPMAEGDNAATRL